MLVLLINIPNKCSFLDYYVPSKLELFQNLHIFFKFMYILDKLLVFSFFMMCCWKMNGKWNEIKKKRSHQNVILFETITK